MSDIHIRKDGQAGRITLTRPQALNAVTWDMVQLIDAALRDWENDDSVALVIIDAEGDRAFAAGGDIVDLYHSGRAGDFDFGRRFWTEEYRLNARIAGNAKPFVAFMQGFVMGGGVGISCHGSYRVVGASTQIAMPECGIGLIPDVGGTRLLAQAPGRLGEYLGLTGARMGAADAIHTGFADSYVDEANWDDLKSDMAATGTLPPVAPAPAPGPLEAQQAEIDALFSGDHMTDILSATLAGDSDAARAAAKHLTKNSPLAMACTLRAIRAARDLTLEQALAQELRYVWRCMEHGDFLEGIRAQVIDKDRSPTWRHADMAAVTEDEIAAMLAGLGDHELTF